MLRKPFYIDPSWAQPEKRLKTADSDIVPYTPKPPYIEPLSKTNSAGGAEEALPSCQGEGKGSSVSSELYWLVEQQSLCFDPTISPFAWEQEALARATDTRYSYSKGNYWENSYRYCMSRSFTVKVLTEGSLSNRWLWIYCKINGLQASGWPRGNIYKSQHLCPQSITRKTDWLHLNSWAQNILWARFLLESWGGLTKLIWPLSVHYRIILYFLHGLKSCNGKTYSSNQSLLHCMQIML